MIIVLLILRKVKYINKNVYWYNVVLYIKYGSWGKVFIVLRSICNVISFFNIIS